MQSPPSGDKERPVRKRKSGRRRDRTRKQTSRPMEVEGTGDFESKPLPGDPLILPRDQHIISRKNIDADCLKVMRRLIRHGYKAFLVGGGVRDLLLGRQPKDFDVSTDADPERVRALFRNSRIIGRRFRMNHVYFKGNKIIEVSTFRSVSDGDEESVQTLARDNTYGDPQTDALRRDLTINGLFYDLETFSVIDYVEGIQDLNNKVVRIIGEPRIRFTEDPVRMIRAVRHAARIDFTIDATTYQAICDMNESICLCPKARVYEEFQRELLGGSALASFKLMEETGLLQYLFPCLMRRLQEDPKDVWRRLEPRLQLLDQWFHDGSEITPAVAFASLLFDNLTLPDEEDPEADPTVQHLAEHWRSDPEQLEAEAQNEDPEKQPPQRQPFLVSRAKSRRKKTSPLMQQINELFEPIGLPRKERERMEQLLVARYQMLVNEPSGSFARTLLRAPYFQDTLKLLQLTLDGEPSRNAFQAWTTVSSESGKKPNKRKKRSRGRSRRRKKRPTQNAAEQS